MPLGIRLIFIFTNACKMCAASLFLGLVTLHNYTLIVLNNPNGKSFVFYFGGAGFKPVCTLVYALKCHLALCLFLYLQMLVKCVYPHFFTFSRTTHATSQHLGKIVPQYSIHVDKVWGLNESLKMGNITFNTWAWNNSLRSSVNLTRCHRYGNKYES